MAERRRHRVCRTLLLIGTGVAGVVGAALLGGYVWLRSPAGNRFLQRQVVQAVDGAMEEGSFSIGELRTDAWRHVALKDVVLRAEDGREVIAADRIDLRIDLTTLISRKVHASHVGVRGLRVDLVEGPGGTLDIERMFGLDQQPPSDEPWQGLPIDLDVPVVDVVDATVAYTSGETTYRVEDLVLRGSVQGSERRIEVVDLGLVGELTSPWQTTVTAEGALAYTGDGLELADLDLVLPESRVQVDGTIAGLEGDTVALDLGVDVGRLAMRDIERFAGEQGLEGVLEGEIGLRGPLDQLEVRARLEGVDETRGEVEVAGLLDATAPDVPWSATVALEDFHVQDIYPQIGEPTRITGQFDLRGRGTAFPDDLEIEGTFRGDAQEILGIPLDRLELDVALKEGRLGIDRAVIRGPIGDLVATGEIDLDRGPIDARVRGTVNLGKLGRFGVEDLAGRARVDARIVGDLQAEPLRLDVTGQATVAPLVYGEDIRFQRAVASYRVEVRGEAVTVDAEATAWEGEVYGAALAVVEAPEVRVEVAPDGAVAVDGIADVQGIRYPDVGRVEEARGRYRVRLAEDGALRVEADADLGAFAVLDFPGTGGTVAIELEDDRLAFDTALVDGPRTFLDTTGTFDLEAQRIRLEDLVLAPTPRQRWEAQGPVRATITDTGVEDARVELTSALGRIAFVGTAGTEGPLDARLVLEGFQLDVISELFPEEVEGLAGRVDLVADLAGTAEEPELEARIDAERVFVEGVSRYLDLEGDVVAREGEVRTDLLVGVAGEPTATVVGRVPVRLNLQDPGLELDREVSLDLAVLPGTLQRFEWLLPDLDLPAGSLSVALGVEGTLRDPDLALGGVLELTVPEWNRPARVELRVDREEETLSWHADAYEGLQYRGSVAGDARTRLGEVIAWALGEGPEPDLEDYSLFVDEIDTVAYLRQVPAESLMRLAGEPADLAGVFEATVAVTGSVLEPVITSASVDWVGARVGEVALQDAYASVVHTGEAYQLQAAFEFPPQETPDGEQLIEGGLEVEGTVPIRIDLAEDVEDWATGELDLAISGAGVPLKLLAGFDTGVSSASGFLTAEGRLVGSPFEPEAKDVRLAIADGEIVYDPLGVRYHDIQLDVDLDRRRLRVAELSSRTDPIEEAWKDLRGRSLLTEVLPNLVGARQQVEGPPNIELTGAAMLEGYELSATSAQITLRNAWLSATPDEVLQVSGTLAVGGGFPDLRITGDLTIDTAYLLIDAAELIGQAPLELHEDLVVHRPGLEREPAPVEEEEPEEPPFWERFVVDVAVDLQRNVELQTTVTYIENLGALGASITAADVVARLGGTVNVGMREGSPALIGAVEVIEGQVGVFRTLLDLEEGTVRFTGMDYTNPLLNLHARKSLATGSIEMRITGTPEDPEIALSSDTYPDETQMLAILLTGREPESAGAGQGAFQALTSYFLQQALGAEQLRIVTIDPDGTVRLSFGLTPDVTGDILLVPQPGLDRNAFTVQLEWTPLNRMVLSAAYGDQYRWADIAYRVRF